MTKDLTKVIYKPDSQSTDEFIAIVNRAEYLKWKDGDHSIPISEVVDSYDVFHTGQGAQGILGKASHQQLDTIFGSHKDIDVIQILLEKGTAQASEGISSGGGTLNAARGSAIVDSRGKGNSGI